MDKRCGTCKHFIPGEGGSGFCAAPVPAYIENIYSNIPDEDDGKHCEAYEAAHGNEIKRVHFKGSGYVRPVARGIVFYNPDGSDAGYLEDILGLPDCTKYDFDMLIIVREKPKHG